MHENVGHGEATTHAGGVGLQVCFGFVGAALLPAVGTCVVLAFGATPGRCCFPRVTQRVPAEGRSTTDSYY